MVVEDDITRFEDWAMSLGCPRNALPPPNDLVRVFSTGQALSFEELMRRVQPKQIVQRTRDEIIVKKMERIDGTMASAKRMIPEQLLRYQKKMKLEQQLAEAKTSIEAKKKQFTDLSTAMKNKNIQKKQLNEQIDSLTAKYSIYHMKIHEIEQQQAEENELAAKIDQVMPVKFSFENGKPEITEAALAAASTELQHFYAEYDHSNRYEANSSARSKIWDSLQTIFARIPNIVLWNVLSKQMEQKVILVEGLAKNDLSKFLSGASNDRPKLEITRLYAKHMRLFIQKYKIKKESESSVNEYVLYYNSFLTNMRAKFCMYNNVEIDDELLGEFMAGFSALSYIKGEMEYLKKVIADNEIEIQHRRKLHEDDRVATEALRQFYKDIEESYFQVRDDMTALVHIKGKIMQSKNSMQYMLQCKNDQQFSVNFGNSTMRANKSGNSSNLNASCESVFSSTMSDSFEKTELRSVPAVTIPNYTNEVKAFMGTPMDVFKQKLPLQWELDFGNNPLLKSAIYTSLPDKVKLIIQDHLVTPRKSLEQLAYDHNWLATMKKSARDIPCSIELPQVDETKLAYIKRQQDEEIAELSDRTTAIFANIGHTLSNVREYINLFKNNPLAKFIPSTKLVDGMSYQDYEREYLMYYNMVQSEE